MGPDPREGAGPESVLAKKLYPSPLGNASKEERYFEHARLKHGFASLCTQTRDPWSVDTRQYAWERSLAGQTTLVIFKNV